MKPLSILLMILGCISFAMGFWVSHKADFRRVNEHNITNYLITMLKSALVYSFGATVIALAMLYDNGELTTSAQWFGTSIICLGGFIILYSLMSFTRWIRMYNEVTDYELLRSHNDAREKPKEREGKPLDHP